MVKRMTMVVAIRKSIHDSIKAIIKQTQPSST